MYRRRQSSMFSDMLLSQHGVHTGMRTKSTLLQSSRFAQERISGSDPAIGGSESRLCLHKLCSDTFTPMRAVSTKNNYKIPIGFTPSTVDCLDTQYCGANIMSIPDEHILLSRIRLNPVICEMIIDKPNLDKANNTNTSVFDIVLLIAMLENLHKIHPKFSDELAEILPELAYKKFIETFKEERIRKCFIDPKSNNPVFSRLEHLLRDIFLVGTAANPNYALFKPNNNSVSFEGAKFFSLSASGTIFIHGFSGTGIIRPIECQYALVLPLERCLNVGQHVLPRMQQIKSRTVYDEKTSKGPTTIYIVIGPNPDILDHKYNGCRVVNNYVRVNEGLKNRYVLTKNVVRRTITTDYGIHSLPGYDPNDDDDVMNADNFGQMIDFTENPKPTRCQKYAAVYDFSYTIGYYFAEYGRTITDIQDELIEQCKYKNKFYVHDFTSSSHPGTYKELGILQWGTFMPDTFMQLVDTNSNVLQFSNFNSICNNSVRRFTKFQVNSSIMPKDLIGPDIPYETIVDHPISSSSPMSSPIPEPIDPESPLPRDHPIDSDSDSDSNSNNTIPSGLYVDIHKGYTSPESHHRSPSHSEHRRLVTGHSTAPSQSQGDTIYGPMTPPGEVEVTLGALLQPVVVWPNGKNDINIPHSNVVQPSDKTPHKSMTINAQPPKSKNVVGKRKQMPDETDSVRISKKANTQPMNIPTQEKDPLPATSALDGLLNGARNVASNNEATPTQKVQKDGTT